MTLFCVPYWFLFYVLYLSKGLLPHTGWLILVSGLYVYGLFTLRSCSELFKCGVNWSFVTKSYRIELFKYLVKLLIKHVKVLIDHIFLIKQYCLCVLIKILMIELLVRELQKH